MVKVNAVTKVQIEEGVGLLLNGSASVGGAVVSTSSAAKASGNNDPSLEALAINQLGIAGLQAAQSLAQLTTTSLDALKALKTGIPVIGVGLSVASYELNLQRAEIEMDEYGGVTNETALGIMSDVVAIGGFFAGVSTVVGGALLVPALVISTPVLAAVAVTSVAVGAYGFLQSEGDTTITQFWVDKFDEAQVVIDASGTAINDFFSDMSATISEGVSSFVDMMMQTGSWWGDFFDSLSGSIEQGIADAFASAQRWFRPVRRDPLTLDLNGNGLETVAPQIPPILFDHQNNGLKQSTGWVAPNDGFLVLDRNGNGTIDSGAELFGDSTPLADGSNAVDGFDALRQEDTNADGVVNSLDANWANLRIWQDLNQDGRSQANELSSLDALGITSINVGATQNSQVLANGNQIADMGTFTYADGTAGSVGTTGGMADINLAVDTFHRTFTDTVPANDVWRLVA